MGYTIASIFTSENLKRELRQKVKFSDAVAALESITGEAWADVQSRHGGVRKWLVLSLARRYAQMTLVELGQEAGAKDYAAVSIGLKRYNAKYKDNKALARLSREIEHMLYVET